VIAYSLQIYCDFSGYTDIAIGVARIIGFDLPENFNMPYLATSISGFWRRWHMTLSAWLRDYLYIPLGGNRRGRGRTYVNLVITMLLGGLWHGASWTFVLWGLYHGLGLTIHKRWREYRARSGATSGLPAPVGWLLTYGFVCAGWILFRAPDLGVAATVFGRLIGPGQGGVQWVFLPFWILLPLVILGHAVGVIMQRGGEASPAGRPRWFPAASFSDGYGFLRQGPLAGPMASAEVLWARIYAG
jgi:alginate O-acetyltransferase complex protein AlgI